MIKDRKNQRRHHGLSGIVIAFLGVFLLALPLAVSAQDYAGSEFCIDCHAENYNLWKVSGHPYKLMKAEEARNRPIPLPEGYEWDDITYVIGGYEWKSRYLGTDGYILTTHFDEDGNEVDGLTQYNNETGEWVDYHAGEMKPYDCGRCHTTGWVADETPDDPTDNQDGLEGIHGTFEFGGVHCEECHGPGMTMEIDDSSEACGRCHIRDDPTTIPASGGFIRHHEQYNEFLASPHDESFTCVSCHNPHKKSEFSIKVDCRDCHGGIAASYAGTTMDDYDVDCIDCHMPEASKSAVAHGPYQGDIQTHLFRINTDPNAEMFTPDGAFVLLDEDGEGAVTLDYACKQCHQYSSTETLAKYAENFHFPELQDFVWNTGMNGNWWNGLDRNGEGFQFQVYVDSNGDLQFVATFYSYNPAGTEQIFLIAVGPVDGDIADVEVFITTPGSYGEGLGDTGEEIPFGVGSFKANSCGSVDMEVMPNTAMQAEGYSDLMYGLTPLAPLDCPVANL
jgi:hypothetical protein